MIRGTAIVRMLAIAALASAGMARESGAADIADSARAADTVPGPSPFCAEFDSAGLTPLLRAAKIGSVEMVGRYLALRCSVSVRDPRGMTPLHYAAMGHSGPKANPVAILKLLLEHGAEIDAVDSSGETPLLLAVKNRDRAVAGFLLGKGADASAADLSGATALHWAAANGDLAIAGQLIDHGAAVSARDRAGRTPLHRAATGRYRHGADSVQTVALVSLLLARGAQVDSRDFAGNTPLLAACRNADETIAQQLLAHGAFVNAAGARGVTPLHWAAFTGRAGLARELCDRGAAVNAPDSAGRGPLHWAAAAGAGLFGDGAVNADTETVASGRIYRECGEDVVRLLVKRGARINESDRNGNTPLHLAAVNGCDSAIILLVRAGALPALTNRSGQTPCDLLSTSDSREYDRTVDLLFSHGAACRKALPPEDPPVVVGVRPWVFADRDVFTARIGVNAENDRFVGRKRRPFRFSYSLEFLSVAAFADRRLFGDYGITWYPAVADALTLTGLTIAGGTHGSQNIGEAFGKGLTGLLVTSPLWAPQVLGNMEFDAGWDLFKLSAGWTTDYFIWKKKAVVFRPRAGIKSALPLNLLLSGGVTTTLMAGDRIEDANRGYLAWYGSVTAVFR